MKSKIWSTGLEKCRLHARYFQCPGLSFMVLRNIWAWNCTICLGGTSGTPIMLTHHVLNKILNFPEGGKDLSLFEVDSYLLNHWAIRLLNHFIKDSTLVNRNQIHFDLDVLKEPYWYFLWLLLVVSLGESIATFPQYVIFVIYMTYCKNVFFD